MSKSVLLTALIIGIGIVGFGVYFVSTPSFITEYSPGYPRSSEIPLYDGQSNPYEIPVYENDSKITEIYTNE